MYRWTITICESDPISAERQRSVHKLLKGGYDYAQAIGYTMGMHQEHPVLTVNSNRIEDRKDTLMRLQKVLDSIL